MKLRYIITIIVGAAIGYVLATTPLLNIAKLDSRSFATYKNMFFKILETGDPAKGMIDKYEVTADVTTEELVEAIKSLAEEYNLRVTGDTKMFTIEENKGQADKIYEARNISMCSIATAKDMLQFSMEFGGFMPCRVMIMTMGDGKRYLLTMSLDMMVTGGFTLPPEIEDIAQKMRIALSEIPRRAAVNDW